MLIPEYEDHARLVAARVAELLRDEPPVTPEYLTVPQASVFLGIPERTLENYRVRDEGGPPFSRIGRIIRYRVSDLRDWMEAICVTP
jgi:hypothetical protein